MTTLRFKADGSDGRVAIYTGADDDPFDEPLDNLSRVLFHSELLYPAIISEQSGTLNLPSRGANSETVASHTLFAHGQSGTPLVIGYATLDSTRVPLAGSVPVQFNARGWARWIALGADGTNVKMAESCFTQLGSGFGGISVPWVAYVLDVTI